MMKSLVILLVLSAGGGPPAQFDGEEDAVRLVIFYDRTCRDAALAAAYRLHQLRYDVVVADMDRPENRNQQERYDIRRLPAYVTYRGHEAWQQTEGRATDLELAQAYHRAFNLERHDLRWFVPSSQAFLGPLDRVYLTRRLSPGSCGMLGCAAHGGHLVIEYVTRTIP